VCSGGIGPTGTLRSEPAGHSWAWCAPLVKIELGRIMLEAHRFVPLLAGILICDAKRVGRQLARMDSAPGAGRTEHRERKGLAMDGVGPELAQGLSVEHCRRALSPDNGAPSP